MISLITAGAVLAFGDFILNETKSQMKEKP